MEVVVDTYAWLPKKDLSFAQIYSLKKELTILPRKTSEQGDDPKPIHMFLETPTHLGVAREFFFENRRPVHIVKNQTTTGNAELWRPFGIFDGVLRDEQNFAIRTVRTELYGGRMGGLIRAPTGWGKCCRENTYIIDSDDGRRSKIVNRVDDCFSVVSLSGSGNVEGSAQNAPVFYSGTKLCAKLRLASGRRLEASLDHPVLTPRGYVGMGELDKGDFVATARRLPEPKHSLNIPDAEVIALGLLLADGNLVHGANKYIKGNEKLVNLFKACAQQLPGFDGFGPIVFERGAWYVPVRGITEWTAEWNLRSKSIDKIVDSRLFGLPNAKLAVLIRALWTDGWIEKSAPYKLAISLSSEALIDWLQDALLRFEVHARKTFAPKRAVRGGPLFDAWRLQIADKDNFLRFLDRIGPVFGMENDLEQLRVLWGAKNSNTNWDVVPIGKNELKQIRQECRHVSAARWDELAGMGSGKYMSRARFEKLVDVTGYSGEYARYATMEIIWDRVESLEPLGEHPVYDLTVPEVHNFVANGLIVHNTVSACALMQELGVPTLVLLHKEFLLNQWKERIEKFLPEASIGHVQQDVCDYRGRSVVLGMIHSVGTGKYPQEFYDWPGLILVDECHRVGAYTWCPVPAMFKARYRVGYTATPRRKDGAENAFFYHIGPIIFSGKEQALKFKVKRVWTKFKLIKTERLNPNLINRSLLLTFLCGSEFRNRLIAEQVIAAVQAGRKAIVLSERLNHLDRIKEFVREMWPNSSGPVPTMDYYVGGRKEEELEVARKAQIILATVQFASEGLDIPELDTLFLTTPISDCEQAVGRILRPHEKKKEPIVVDFRDDAVPILEKMGKKRDTFYDRVS